MADPPRRAADHRAVRGRAGGGVTPDGGIAGGPSDDGTPDAGTPSTASTLAQRQDCLVYTHTMPREDDERARLQAVIEGVDWGTSAHQPQDRATARHRSNTRRKRKAPPKQ